MGMAGGGVGGGFWAGEVEYGNGGCVAWAGGGDVLRGRGWLVLPLGGDGCC